MARYGAGEEIGLVRLQDWAGTIDREPIARLRGLNGVKAYREMRWNSAAVGGALMAIEMSIRSVSWSVEGDANDPRRQFLEECMDDMAHSVAAHVIQALSMLTYGWAWFEVVYKQRRGDRKDAPSKYTDGKLGWDAFRLRAQDTMHPSTPWHFDERGRLTGFQQYLNTGQPIIPADKSIHYVTRNEDGNPEGKSILRPAYRAWFFLKNLQEIEAIGHERNLVGLPVLKPPEGADLSEGSNDRSAAEKLLRRVRKDEEAGVLVPPGWDFQLAGISGAPNVADALGNTIVRYENRIALSVLAQFLFLGISGTGSYALGETHSNLFFVALEAWLDMIADTLNQQAVPNLLRYNAMPLEDHPRIAHEPVRSQDPESVANFILNMVNAGVVQPDDDLERWVRAIIDAPDLTELQLKEREMMREADRALREKMARIAPKPPAEDGDETDESDDLSLYEQYAAPLTEWEALNRQERREIMGIGRRVLDVTEPARRARALRDLSDAEWGRALAEEQRAQALQTEAGL